MKFIFLIQQKNNQINMQDIGDIKRSCYELSNLIHKEKEQILRSVKNRFQSLIDEVTDYFHGLLNKMQFGLNDFLDKFKAFQNKLLSQTLDSSVFLKNINFQQQYNIQDLTKLRDIQFTYIPKLKIAASNLQQIYRDFMISQDQVNKLIQDKFTNNILNIVKDEEFEKYFSSINLLNFTLQDNQVRQPTPLLFKEVHLFGLKQTFALSHHNPVCDIVKGSQPNHIASSHYNGYIAEWDILLGRKIKPINLGRGAVLNFKHLRDQIYLTSHVDRHIQIFDITKLKSSDNDITFFKAEYSMPTCVESMRENQFLVGHEAGMLDLFDWGQGNIEFIQTLDTEVNSEITSLCKIDPSVFMASQSVGNIIIYDLRQAKQKVHSMRVRGGVIKNVNYLQGQNVFAYCGTDSVYLSDLRQFKLLRKWSNIHDGSLTKIQMFCKDSIGIDQFISGLSICSGGMDGMVKYWNIGQYDNQTQELSGHRDSIWSLYKMDSDLFSGGRDGMIFHWCNEVQHELQ